nr:Abi family protein [Microbacterium sp. Marseille-Q6965]
MDPATVASFPALLGSARLAPYASRYRGNEQLALRLHAWNMELSTAFWGPIALLEVSLRNSIHDALRADRQDDWWNNSSLVRMASREERAITRALDKLADAGNYHPTADDVVASTAMGLWVGLLDVGVARDPFLDYETALWQPRLKNAFPHRGGHGRRQIHSRLNRIRVFRNRIAHHEPIHNKNPAGMRDLIVECLGFIHPDLAAYVRDAHRIDDVLNRKREAVESGICVL